MFPAPEASPTIISSSADHDRTVSLSSGDTWVGRPLIRLYDAITPVAARAVSAGWNALYSYSCRTRGRTLADTRLRSASTLYAAKCFSVGAVLRYRGSSPCRPRPYAVAISLVSSGSSAYPSSLRPHRGSRNWFTTGAHMFSPFFAGSSLLNPRASSPTAAPTRLIRSGSHVLPKPDSLRKDSRLPQPSHPVQRLGTSLERRDPQPRNRRLVLMQQRDLLVQRQPAGQIVQPRFKRQGRDSGTAEPPRPVRSAPQERRNEQQRQ